MNYVILVKAKPYTRTKRGKLERVKGYLSKEKQGGEAGYTEYHGTTASNIYKILFEGLKPQSYHNFDPDHFEGVRARRVFVADDFRIAKMFAKISEKKQHSPGVILKVVIPNSFWEAKAGMDKKLIEAGYAGCFMVPKVKPEWIVDALDTNGKPMTKTIDSLRLKRFEKAGKLFYIPVTLAVLRKIFEKGEK